VNMALFDSQVTGILQIRERLQQGGKSTWFLDHAAADWPCGGNRNFVMQHETGVELGGPKTESIALTLWTDRAQVVTDRRITLLGPPLADCTGGSRPFGQIVLLELGTASGFEDDYQLFRSLEEIKYRIDLRGYMRRGASQFLREWSRISREALDSGFDFSVMGNALAKLFRRQECVRGVEVLFITELAALRELKPVAVQVQRIIEALNKMLHEEITDCDDCEYNDICAQAAELRKQK